MSNKQWAIGLAVIFLVKPGVLVPWWQEKRFCKMKKLVTIIILLIHFSVSTEAQNINEGSYFSLMSENDLYSFPGGNTDRYYTNGLRLDYHFSKKKFQFPSTLLLKISDDKNVFGWGLAQYMFTPSRIDIRTVQYDDRPYAGALFGIYSLSSSDYEKKIRLTSEIYFGVMGPLSFAEEAQTAVHKFIRSPHPEGWTNQVPNDVVLNYNLHLEKEIVYVSEKLLVTGNMETFAGTMYDAMGAGFSVKIGRIKNYLKKNERMENKPKSQIYVVLRPTVRIIYFNALLQGGVITNISDSHTGFRLGKDQIERINVFTEAGITYERPGVSISLLQKMRSAPFKGGNALEYGSVTVAFAIKH